MAGAWPCVLERASSIADRDFSEITMAKVTVEEIVREMWHDFEERAATQGLRPEDIKTAIEFLPKTILQIGEGLLGLWNSKAKGGWAKIGPRWLDPTWENGTVWADVGRRTFLAPAPKASQTKILVDKLD